MRPKEQNTTLQYRNDTQPNNINNGEAVQTNSVTALIDSSAKGGRVGIWAQAHWDHGKICEFLMHTGKASNY